MRAVVIHAAKDLRIEPARLDALGPAQVRIRIERGGICGSDLHYYHDGGFGMIRIKEPMVLGHEVAGIVEATGAEVARVKAGDRVSVNPSRPCGRCRFCQAGQQMHCLDMRFYGSAMRMPHSQGAFREILIADEAQCFVVPPSLSAGEAAMCEPFAVCLHAARRAGPLLGKRVLITGCGPIGALAIIAARQAGAAEIVVTDVAQTPFATARRLGADRTINIAAERHALASYARDKGTFDALFECSGNEKALTGALDALRPTGVIVQVGLGGVFTLPINVIVAKELELKGTFRFHEEFGIAAELIGKGRVDVKPLITATLPFEEAIAAFELASDRSQSMKVQLAFA